MDILTPAQLAAAYRNLPPLHPPANFPHIVAPAIPLQPLIIDQVVQLPRLPQPMQLPIARQPFDPAWVIHSLGDMDILCPFCHAFHWSSEQLASSTIDNPKFGMCCYQGKITLPPVQPVPNVLRRLLDGQNTVSKEFRKHIRNYNSALAMTSVGRVIDDSINRARGPNRGPYTFKLRGELIHRAGSLLPPEGQAPLYSQLYILDAAEAFEHRERNSYNSDLDTIVLKNLQDMLYSNHPGVRHYKQAKELTRHMPPDQQCRIALRFNQSTDRRRYNTPAENVQEIAVILPEDGETPANSQDIILYRRAGNGLQRIWDSHPFYPSLRYVLLFPTGQLGWDSKIPYNEREEGGARVREYVSLQEFHRYRFHIRPTYFESNHLFLAGKLFQEYVCESWAVAEQKRLGQLRHSQTKLRSEVYQGLADAVAANADTNPDELGKRIILPSSFAGSTRNMPTIHVAPI